MRLAGTGIWSGELRYGEAGEKREAAAELEELGYSALWIPDVASSRVRTELARARLARRGFDAVDPHDPTPALLAHDRLSRRFPCHGVPPSSDTSLIHLRPNEKKPRLEGGVDGTDVQVRALVAGGDVGTRTYDPCLQSRTEGGRTVTCQDVACRTMTPRSR
jgi:hypothetical protein